MSEFRMCPVGNQAILCEFGNAIDEEINNQVHCLKKCILEKNIDGVVEILPTYRSLLVFYNSSIISYRQLTKKIGSIDIKIENNEMQNKKIRVVPCLYGGEYGPDLKQMSDELGMEENQIINIHQSVDYKIYMLGFLPGFVYLGGLDKRIHMPRLDVPRTKIPARSVGIGGSQTGVYPVESPGGWRLIGSTPLEFYSPFKEPPVLCKAGEYIRFVAVSKKDYEIIRKDVENGVYKAEYL
jgi:KipI family sensor histidine kinase inhibitor